MKMKENDPRLTAYALGELSADEAAEVARELAQHPELKREVEMIGELADCLSAGLGDGGTLKLRPDQRAAIFQSAAPENVETLASMKQRNWVRPVMATLGVAAAVAVCFSLIRHGGKEGGQGSLAQEWSQISDKDLTAPVIPNTDEWGEKVAASASAPSKPAPTTSPERMTQAMRERALEVRAEIQRRALEVDQALQSIRTERGWVIANSSESMRLPLVSGASSWQWVKRSVENDTRPAKQVVRCEELVNHFRYHAPADLSVGALSAGVEVVQSPWSDERLVAVILLKNTADEAVACEAAVRFGEKVMSQRLLGFGTPAAGGKAQRSPSQLLMPAGYTQMIIYELKPDASLQTGDVVATVEVRAGLGEAAVARALPIEFTPRQWSQSSQDVKFALLIASWSQHLSASAYRGQMDAPRLLKMVTELERSSTANEKRMAALALIRRSL